MKVVENKNNDNKNKLGTVSIGISFLIHLVIFLAVLFYFKVFHIRYNVPGSYVEVSTVRGNLSQGQADPQFNEDRNISDPSRQPEEVKKETGILNKLNSASNKVSTSPSKNPAASGDYSPISATGFDSTSLNQIYQEPTLNVRLKYPVGWVYVDQQKRNKLDGITFWAAVGDYNPPPYIHVEVVDKYMFIPDQYKYKYEFKDFEGYYNDPVELANQVTQSIYLRTGADDKDFIIKLIMNGKDQFNRFQPVFFSIVNSFKFGSSLF